MRKQRRVVVWFSCGAASATASYLALKKYDVDRVRLVYCNVLSSEHPSNKTFLKSVEKWLHKDVEIISSSKYVSIDDVFERTRYMAGISGARCTTEMKKIPRFQYQLPSDIHVFGMTADEIKRIDRLDANNPELRLDWVLRDEGYTKQMCLDLVANVGIELPAMYGFGFRNNNCIGCVKATSIAYWKKVRKLFPETFERRSFQSRKLGVRLTRLHGERIFIDEIPYDEIDEEITENISCGPDCNDNAD